MTLSPIVNNPIVGAVGPVPIQTAAQKAATSAISLAPVDILEATSDHAGAVVQTAKVNAAPLSIGAALTQLADGSYDLSSYIADQAARDAVGNFAGYRRLRTSEG